MSWVTPAFDSKDEELGRPTMDREFRIRQSGSLVKRPRLLMEKAWVDSYSPSCKDHLAVHTKKIQEVEGWLSAATRGKIGRSPIAVLTGPSGCGKTATLLAAAKSLDFSVKEWVNPTNYKSDGPGITSQEFLGYANQVEQFEDFLFRASRYQDLFVVNTKYRLLLVEDFPNIFLHDSTLLEKTLRKYVEVGRCPLVFICSSGSSQNIEKLFKPVQVELNIEFINFNPINKTLMSKSLERVLKAAKKDLSISEVEAKIIEDAVDVANGDIRFAINHLQYVLLGEKAAVDSGTPPEHAPTRNVARGGPKSELSNSMRDKPADIFRCLGGVLYNKKATAAGRKTSADSQRPTQCPDDISSKMSSVPHLFHGLLCENYPSVISDINCIASASFVLSQTDVMLNQHTESGEKGIFKNYAVDMSVHGLMNLPPSVATRKFLPFKGARVKEAKLTVQSRMKKCSDVFPAASVSPKVVLTEVCPFISKGKMGALSGDQKKFVNDVSQPTSLRRTPVDDLFEEEDDEKIPANSVVDVLTEQKPDGVEMELTDDIDIIDIADSSSDESDCIQRF